MSNPIDDVTHPPVPRAVRPSWCKGPGGENAVIHAGATLLDRVALGARSAIGGDVRLLFDGGVTQPEARLLEARAARGLLDALAEAA